MTTPTQPQDFDESVMFRAVEWLEIHRRGDITSATRNEFLFWLRKSPINVEHYIYAATTAEMYRLALKSRTEATEDLIRQARNDNSGVISLTLSRQPSSRIAAAPQRFVFTKRLGLISPVVAAAFFIVLLFVRELISDGYIGFPTKYQTQHTEQGSWRLPDGSMLHLNSGSEAIVWYTNRERFIEPFYKARKEMICRRIKELENHTLSPYWTNLYLAIQRTASTRSIVSRRKRRDASRKPRRTGSPRAHRNT
jgi:ferric-dicitrate binding protein FerR (iron transport regulator)